MMHPDLGQHRVILDLTLTQRRTIVRDQHELGLSLTQRLEALLVPEVYRPDRVTMARRALMPSAAFFELCLGAMRTCAFVRAFLRTSRSSAPRHTRVPARESVRRRRVDE